MTAEFVMAASQAWIFACYVTFALQVAVQADWKRIHRVRATSVASLIAVFLLCAVSGYLSKLIGIGPWGSAVFHALLVVASATLIVTNQGRTIAKMLSGD